MSHRSSRFRAARDGGSIAPEALARVENTLCQTHPGRRTAHATPVSEPRAWRPRSLLSACRFHIYYVA